MKKIFQRNLFDPIFYAYKGRYIKGRRLGNILAGLSVMASVVMGYCTKEAIFDTIICAVTLGNYLRNIGIFILLSKLGDCDYYAYEDESGQCEEIIKKDRIWLYDEMIKKAHRITFSFGYFELYFPFLLIIIIQDKLWKMIIPLIFIIGTTIIKLRCNPVKNEEYPKKKILWFYILSKNYYRMRIIARTLLFNGLFYVAGLVLSCQSVFTVKIFGDLKILIPILVLGILYNIQNDIKVLRVYKGGKKKITFEFINRMLANYFGFNTREEVYEQREREKREKEEEERRKQEESEREFEERRLRIAKMWFFKENERIEKYRKEEERRKEEEKRKEEEERIRKAQKKLDEGKIASISKEDLDKLIQREEEKYRVEIKDSSRVSRGLVKRKI